MRGTVRDHLNRGATSLDAALAGVGVEVATPPLARLGRALMTAELGPRDAFRRELRQRLLT